MVSEMMRARPKPPPVATDTLDYLMSNAKRIVSVLSDAIAGPAVFNPWRDYDPMDLTELGWLARCERLVRHFLTRPKLLLVGEAPGYQGCHFSGVPFTSESLLCEGVIPRIDKCGRFTTRPRPWCEPSATIVWRELHRLGIAEKTVMWNAFAFHPHKPGKLYSNRAPTKEELSANRRILNMVVRHFRGARVVAIGNVAHKALADLGYRVDKVRHPSMGGANEFRAGLAELVREA